MVYLDKYSDEVIYVQSNMDMPRRLNFAEAKVVNFIIANDLLDSPVYEKELVKFLFIDSIAIKKAIRSLKLDGVLQTRRHPSKKVKMVRLSAEFRMGGKVINSWQWVTDLHGRRVKGICREMEVVNA